MPISTYQMPVIIPKRRVRHTPQHESKSLNHSLPMSIINRTYTKKSNPMPCPVPSGPFDEENEVSSMERQYDWATWRMYDRITSARCKRAQIVPHFAKMSDDVIAQKPMVTFDSQKGNTLLPHNEYETNDEISEDICDESSGVFILD